MTNIKINKDAILQFLRDTAIMSIAINNTNNPVSSVVLFAVDDDYTFYFAAHSTSHKAQALEKDNRISLSCWEHKKMLVQGSGIALKITDPRKMDVVLDKLASSTTNIDKFWPPILRLEADEYSIFQISMNWLRALDIEHDKVKDKELPMQEIEL